MKVSSSVQVYGEVVRDTAPRRGDGDAAAAARQKEVNHFDAPDKVTVSDDAKKVNAQHLLQTKMQEKISAMFEKYGIEMDGAMSLDVSVDATAQRIFDSAVGYFGLWKQQHPEASESDLIDTFESTIRGAVDQGYGEAMDILEGMDLSKDVLDTSRKTKSKIDELFDAHFTQMRTDLSGAAKPTDKKTVG